MTWEVFLAAGIGIVATYLTGLIRKLNPTMGARETQAIVFGVCFFASAIVWLVQRYAPPEVIAMLGGSFATAVAWYEVVVKKHS